MSAFWAPSRNDLRHVYIKIMLHEYAHTLRETAADSRAARVSLRNERYCVLSLFLIVLCYVLAKLNNKQSKNSLTIYLGCFSVHISPFTALCMFAI